MARLPIIGSDSGDWGSILNDFLSVEHNADGTLNPNASLATKVPTTRIINAGTGLSGGGTLDSDVTISANFGTASGTIAQGNHTHARLSGIYPLSAYGFFSASGAIESFTANSTLGGIFFARIFVPANTPIAGIGTIVRVAGTLSGGGQNGFAIYEDNGTFDVASVSDNNLWATTGWQTKTFTTPVAAQTSDRFVLAAVLVNGYSAAPYILYNIQGGGITGTTGGGYNMPNHRRAFYQNNVASWPVSITPTTYGLDPNGYVPLIAIA